jgi:hypothetical protein
MRANAYSGRKTMRIFTRLARITLLLAIALVLAPTTAAHHAVSHKAIVIDQIASISRTLVCDTEAQVRSVLDAQQKEGIEKAVKVFAMLYAQRNEHGEPLCAFQALVVMVREQVAEYKNMTDSSGTHTYYVVRVEDSNMRTFYAVVTWPVEVKPVGLPI